MSLFGIRPHSTRWEARSSSAFHLISFCWVSRSFHVRDGECDAGVPRVETNSGTAGSRLAVPETAASCQSSIRLSRDTLGRIMKYHDAALRPSFYNLSFLFYVVLTAMNAARNNECLTRLSSIHQNCPGCRSVVPAIETSSSFSPQLSHLTYPPSLKPARYPRSLGGLFGERMTALLYYLSCLQTLVKSLRCGGYSGGDISTSRLLIVMEDR